MEYNILDMLPEKKKGNSLVKTLIWILVISFIVWGFSGIEYKGVMETASGTLAKMWDGLIHPDIDYLKNTTIDGLPYAIIETIAIAVGGTFLSGILAIPVALISSENIVGRKVAKVGKFIIILIRTFPELILALIFISIVGVGAPAGLLALGIHSIGMLAKLYSESIESMDIGVKEGIEACGGNSAEVLFRAVLPQVAPEFMSYTLFRFEINMRAASVLGLVGAGGIGVPLILASRGRHWDRVAIILITLVITVSIIDMISSSIRKRLTK